MPQKPARYRPTPKRPPPSHLTRGSTTDRGYGYRWQQLRVHILNRDPLCVVCKEKGLVVESTTVDHIIPLVQGGTDDDTNLRGLCAHCQAVKSQADKAGKK
jgi:5-methylcytosine-specific restriction enzyme A